MVAAILSSTIPSAAIATWSNSVLLGWAIVVSLILVIAFSSQRWLLWYILGGVIYWLFVEAVYSVLTSFMTLSEWHNYVMAIAISWVPLFAWILYRALRYEDVSYGLQQQRQTKSARYIEHSPIYDNYTPRFD